MKIQTYNLKGSIFMCAKQHLTVLKIEKVFTNLLGINK